MKEKTEKHTVFRMFLILNEKIGGKMRKLKLFIFMVLFGTLGSSVFAQWAVLDAANLIQTIETVYQTYQQIQVAIENVQNTYKQIEQAAQQMATINFDDLKNLGDNFSGIKDNPFEFITGVRNSAQDITKSVNKQMNKVNNLRDSLTKQSIKFGGMEVSVADLCGAGDAEKDLIGFTKNAWNSLVDSTKDAVAGYVGKLDYKQKEAIAKQYGMSPENYASLTLANYQLSEAVKESVMLSTTEGMSKDLEEIMAEAEALKQVSDKLPEGNINGQVQLLNSGLAQTEILLGKLGKSITSGIRVVSNFILNENAKDAIKDKTKQKNLENMQTDLKSSSSTDIDDV